MLSIEKWEKQSMQTIGKLATNLSYTVGEKKDSTLHRAYGVKLPLLRAVWAGQGLILALEK